MKTRFPKTKHNQGVKPTCTTGAKPRALPASSAMHVLEPRIAFDAALAATVAAADDGADSSDAAPAEAAAASAAETAAADLAALASALADSPASAPANAGGSTIVFIDAAVRDPAAVAAAIPAGAEIVTLEAGRDGLSQIADALAGRSGITAVHIVSHGSEGELNLGNASIDQASLLTHADDLLAIRDALAADADILLYGCDVASGETGALFLSALADATGADVAASTDDTGHADLGGDWVLEARTGDIEAASIDAPEWNGELAPLVIRASGNPAVAGTGGVGTTALWLNAGTLGGSSIDLRATVIDFTPGFAGATTPFFGTLGDDVFVQLTQQSSVTLRWEIFASGTSQTVYAVGSPEFRISDIDGVGGAPFTRESVSPQLGGLQNYTVSTPTNVQVSVVGSELRAAGTQDQNGETNSMVGFTWSEVSSWDVKYQLHINDSRIQARFLHDGDGDFTFAAPNTVSLLSLDLDDDNSTATGTGYQTIFTENGAAVRVVDADLAIAQHAALGTDLSAATVTLTNAQAGDVLSVGTLPPGITATIDTSVPGQIAVTLSGTASVADYQTALGAITFSNGSDAPLAVDRTITANVTNATFGTISNTAISTIHVVPVNDAPVADNAAITVVEASADTPLGLSAPTDIDGPTSTITVTGLPSVGTVTLANGTAVTNGMTLTSAQLTGLQFDAPADLATTTNTSFTYTVSDGIAAAVTGTATITVTPVNDAPVAVDDNASVSENGPSATGNVVTDALTGDTDPDSDPLTVASAHQGGNAITLGVPFTTAGGGSLTLSADGSWSFDPGTAYNGLDDGETAVEVITYTVSDGNGGTDIATLTITVVGQNDAPVVVDPGNPGTPDNPTPADPASIIPVQTAIDGESFTPAAPLVDVSDFAADPDGDALTFTTTDPLPVGLTLNPDGTVTGTIDKAASQGGPAGDGVYPITVTISDGTTTTTVALTLDVGNLPPVAVDDAASPTENATVSGNVITDAATGDADTAPDSDPLTVASAHQGGSPITLGVPFTTAGGGSLTLGADGSWSFDPGTAYNGLDDGETAVEVITYTVSDGNGGTDIATLTITVVGQNDAPVVVDPGNPGTPDNPTPADPASIIPVQTATDGESFTPASPLVDVSDFAADPDGDPLTFTTTDPLPVGLTLNPDGTVTGTIDKAASQGGPAGDGVYPITVTISDGTTTTTVALTLDVSNLPPVAVDDAASPTENATVSGNVITDAATGDADTAPDSDPLTVASAHQGGNAITLGVPFTTAGGGSLTLSSDGSWSFNPGTAYNGLDDGETAVEVITYTVSDGNGGTDIATLTITVVGQNDAPVANPDTATVRPGQSVTIPVLGNDSDPDGNRLRVIAASSSDGSVRILANGSLQFTPRPGFFGAASIRYVVDDGHGGQAWSTVTVEVPGEDFAVLSFVESGGSDTPPVQLPPSLTVTGAVIAAVNGAIDLAANPVQAAIDQLGQLGGQSGIARLFSLNGSADLSQGPGAVATIVDHIAASQALAGLGIEGLIGLEQGFDLERLSGFSLRYGEAGGISNVVTIETIVTGDVLVMRLSPTMAEGGVKIVSYRFETLAGAPVPGWLEPAGDSILLGRHPADVERIGLRVIAVLEDGTELMREVSVETRTGEITDRLGSRRAEVPVFSDQLEARERLGAGEVEALGRAVAR